jgi:arylsulfatase A-like enzyme
MIMKLRQYFVACTLGLVMAGCHSGDKAPAGQGAHSAPNIVYILADDLGYGDISVNNPESKIHTPHVDSLAGQGMRFTDAHAPSSVCTPSRYGLLTGRYCWRSDLPQGVLQGYGRALISKGQLTIATFLKAHGYQTAVIGKWHLGLDWAVRPGHESALAVEPNADSAKIAQNVDPADLDFTRPVTDGPREHGFDYSYVLPASLDMPPYCYVQNDTLTAPLTDSTPGSNVYPKGSPNYAIDSFWRGGLMAQGFDFRDVLPNFTRHAVSYIQEHAASEDPYFLYFAMSAPHTPWLPSKKFLGTSGAGDYGDFVTMVDAMVGKVIDAIEQSGQASNTIIIFASDNGPYWRPAFIERYHHHAAYVYRGMKADTWEGGHRIPFMVRWDGRIKAGTRSAVTTTLTNLIATCSDLLDGKDKVASAVDSYSILPVLLGEKDASSRVPQLIVNESSQGMFAVRKGPWKLIEGLGSGGFSQPVWGVQTPGGPPGQLYNLQQDSSETQNLYQKFPERVQEMKRLLDSIKSLPVGS